MPFKGILNPTRFATPKASVKEAPGAPSARIPDAVNGYANRVSGLPEGLIVSGKCVGVALYKAPGSGLDLGVCVCFEYETA